VVNPPKRKGDSAEREIATQLTELLGVPVRRKLGAGRTDDTGDLDGVHNTVVQVKNYRNIADAINQAMTDLPVQQTNAGTAHAVAMIRRPRGRWIAVMTIEQFAAYHHAANSA